MKKNAGDRVVVGITCDMDVIGGLDRAHCRMTYARAVQRAGGVPVLLPPGEGLAQGQIELCDAFVLTGGDDPDMTPFGRQTHPGVTLVHPARQTHETALLQELDHRPGVPVLGVCLGMQMMALAAGGDLFQYLPDSHTGIAPHHWEQEHEVVPVDSEKIELRGPVRSRHKQAVSGAGSLRVIAMSPDGLIEAVADPTRRFYVGVQWHPERTRCPAVGDALFERLVARAREGLPRNGG